MGVGNYGRHSDSAIFENSVFYQQFVHDKIILPPKPLPGTEVSVPHVFVGDEGFPLQTYLMRPYPKSGVINNVRKKTFNRQLSRARRVVENAFGILAMKWRLFLRPIETDEGTADWIVKAACCLHNYIITKIGNRESVIETDEQVEPIRALAATTPTNRRSNAVAFEVREHFADYFSK
ncbi:unnamed protein product [Acanthoscelides obtectus]|uniref:DDE Tnp4 domain-containing protein n=1 Tax=Acanthoscelides obtectus TaxID=200917 RepID=A0A9P0LS57_ACAOB|nr:unnamed protein product [Acanthoscelides obtectus]CAK1681159.1 Protein ALP1-like [Acanthoscelides obtectus]